MDQLYKVIILGDSKVGKSNLQLRLCFDKFEADIKSSCIDFANKKFQDKELKMQVWDTSAKENFKLFTTAYFRDAVGAVIVYDITNRSSFTNVKHYLHQIKEYTPNNICILLIGNKTDLLDQREISTEEAQTFASENNLLFKETSALKGENVTEAFEGVHNKIYEVLKYQN